MKQKQKDNPKMMLALPSGLKKLPGKLARCSSYTDGNSAPPQAPAKHTHPQQPEPASWFTRKENKEDGNITESK